MDMPHHFDADWMCRKERKGKERQGKERKGMDDSLQRSRVETCADLGDYGSRFRCLRSSGHLQQVARLRDEGHADLRRQGNRF